MKHDLKLLLGAARPRAVRELLQSHLRDVVRSDAQDQTVLLVDKQYAFQQLTDSGHLPDVVESAKAAFGDKQKIVIEVVSDRSRRNRDKAVPHVIHAG